MAAAQHSGHTDVAVETYFPAQHRLAAAGTLLTGPAIGDPFQIATDYLHGHAADLGLNPNDLSSFLVSSQYTDEPSGITHIYLRQTHGGLEILNADLGIHVSARGEVISVSSRFLSDPQLVGGAASTNPIGALQALSELSESVGLKFVAAPQVLSADSDSPDLATVLAASGMARATVPAKLVYVPTAEGLELAWRLNVQTVDMAHWYDAVVDADSGRLFSADDWIDYAAYDVFASPIVSPNEGGRSLIVDPQDPTASPYGWHDTDGVAGAEFTDTRGNNASVQEDSDGNDMGGFRPSGGEDLIFDFPLDTSQNPAGYQSAAMTNMFYWINRLHDIHYQYGFTEAAGNFQVNNYGQGGVGNDAVMADLQDGDGGAGPSFVTPPDGQSPRMTMYLNSTVSPARDSALDNTVLIHEYGHGISERLTGGPANTSALNALQSSGMSEGWSDWWALMLTQDAGDSKLGAYPVGNYYFGQGLNGAGARRYPYSFDKAVNPLTLGDFNNATTRSSRHKMGEIWASALWDMNWLLVDKYGFSSDYSHGAGGNNLALQLVMDALKLQGTNPSYLDGRNAILTADVALTGGQNQAEIWTAFARRGMGLSASDGGSASATSVSEAFDTPGFISGTVFRDDDADGVRDGSEPGLPGWTVYRDLNNNSVLDVATTTTFTAADTPRAIPNQSNTTSSIVIAGLSGVIVDVNVNVNITHPADGELNLALLPPSGTPVILAQFLGGTGDNYTNTVFDDEAVTSITSASAPFAGVFKPFYSLSQLDGGSPNGTWKLRLDDVAAGNSGTLLSWSIQISYGTPDPTAVTDANGNYTFFGIGEGTHHIREIVPAGFTQSAPAGGFHDVVLTGGQGITGRDFGNRAAAVVVNGTTVEDTLSSALVITPPPGSGATHFRISGITGGALFHSDGSTPIHDGDFITEADGQAGVRFLPSPNRTAAGRFDVELSENGMTVPASASRSTTTITITPIGDTPQAANITTLENTLSGAILLNRNPLDGTEVTHFRISGITGGTLLKSDGVTPLNNGDFLTVAERQAGVKFLPSLHSTADGRFDVESSQDGSTVAVQSGKATSTITVTPGSHFGVTVGGFSGALSYRENATPLLLDTSVTIAGANAPNLAFLSLVVTVTQNGEAGDCLGLLNQGTAAGKVGMNGSLVTFGGVLVGHVSGGTGATPLSVLLNANCTQAALQALIQNLTYSNAADAPLTAPKQIRLQVDSGHGMLSPPVFKTVAVTPVNDAPVLASFGGTTPFVEAGGPVLVDADATIIDPDSVNFDTGRLTVKISTNAHADDRLTIRNQGTGAGQVGISGTNVTFGSLLIGTLSGGTGLTPLVVTFKAAADAAAVQAVLRNVLFSNISTNPTMLARTLQATLTDGDGGTSATVAKSVTVQAVNTPPTVVVGAGINFARGGAPVLIAAMGTVADPDSADFNGGRLTVQMTANAEATDQLRIVNQGTGLGKIGLSGSNVTFSGTVIGTWAGGDGNTPLVITFTSNAVTAAVAQTLLRDITFGSSTATPANLPRTIEVVLNDGDGAASAPASKTIHIIHNTTIGGWDGTTAYTENAAPVVIDSAITLTDTDTLAFGGFVLTLAISANGTADDRLAIRHQGNGANQIGFDGSTVRCQGTIIGTASGGTGATPLTVLLNASATKAAVQMLIQNLTFANVSDAPATTPRTVQLQFVDPAGYVNPAVVKTVTVTPTNDAPTLGAFGGTTPFVEAAGPVEVDADATVVDPDSPNFDTGKLTVKISANGHADDRLTLRNEGVGIGQVGVQTVGTTTNVTFGGVLIGTLSGGMGTTPLVVTFKAAADAAVVQAVLRCVLFSNVSANPTTLPRTLQASLTDRDGGTSQTVSKTVTVQAVNTPPTVVVGPAVNSLRGGPAVLMAATATVADPDSTNFNGGRLTVELAANAEGADQLRITNQGTSSGKIGIAGNVVTFGGVNNVIGTFTGGDGATPLVITFTSDLANAASVQALLRAITFANAASSPLPRMLQVTLEDGDGATSVASAKSVNIINNTTIGGWDGTMGYTENAPPVLIDSTVTLTDPDTTSFNNFVLTAALTVNGTVDDRLGIRNQGNGTGQIGFDGTTVRYQGMTIGTATGGLGLTPLTIVLNDSATKSAVQMLIQNLTFANASDAPSTLPRTVTLTLADENGFASAAVSKTQTVTAVNDAPVLGSFGGSVDYTSGGQGVLIDDDATVTDVDRLDFATGKLTLQLTNNAQSTDRLRVRHTGIGAGEIGVDGSTIKYGGVTIGTFTGGAGTTALVITLTDRADADAVQVLLRSMEFTSTAFAPSLLPRTIRATLTDGDGGTSNTPTKTINVV